MYNASIIYVYFYFTIKNYIEKTYLIKSIKNTVIFYMVIGLGL